MTTDQTSTAASPPAWWPGLYATRQERLRTVFRRRARALGPDGARAAKYFVEGAKARYEPAEIEDAIGALVAEGLLRREKRPGRDQKGTRVVEEWFTSG